MTIRHITLSEGNITEALYTHKGRPMCSRFRGFINAAEAQQILKAYRKAA